MRKRFTRKYRHWSPRGKWSPRAWAELTGFEHDVRTGLLDDDIEDALHPSAYGRGADLGEIVRCLIREDPPRERDDPPADPASGGVPAVR